MAMNPPIGDTEALAKAVAEASAPEAQLAKEEAQSQQRAYTEATSRVLDEIANASAAGQVFGAPGQSFEDAVKAEMQNPGVTTLQRMQQQEAMSSASRRWNSKPGLCVRQPPPLLALPPPDLPLKRRP